MSKIKEASFDFTLPILSAISLVFLISKVFQIGIAKDWSWWEVFCPLWVPGAVVMGILIVIFLTLCILKALLWVIISALDGKWRIFSSQKAKRTDNFRPKSIQRWGTGYKRLKG